MNWIYCLLFLYACNTADMEKKRYDVNEIPAGQMQIDGKGSASFWKEAVPLNDFHYPWRKETAPKTVFKALYDKEKLYLFYEAEDQEIVTKKSGLAERAVLDSDRIEIFLKADSDEAPYYSLELDALGRILDTEGYFGKGVEFDWQWPENHLTVLAHTNPTSYTVEVAISFKSLEKLGLWTPGQKYLNAGLYRGEYTHAPSGELIVKWMSWVDPGTPTPNFHTPTSFGVLALK